jgi:hypothetical protein
MSTAGASLVSPIPCSGDPGHWPGRSEYGNSQSLRLVVLEGHACLAWARLHAAQAWSHGSLKVLLSRMVALDPLA